MKIIGQSRRFPPKYGSNALNIVIAMASPVPFGFAQDAFPETVFGFGLFNENRRKHLKLFVQAVEALNEDVGVNPI